MVRRWTTAFWPITSRSQRGLNALSRSRSSGGSSERSVGSRPMQSSQLLAIHFVDVIQHRFDRVATVPAREQLIEQIAGLERRVAQTQQGVVSILENLSPGIVHRSTALLFATQS